MSALTQVDAVADTNGAGDTFATAYMLALASGWRSPGGFANWAASRAVMRPQSCKPQCVQEGLVANSTFAQVSTWLTHQASLSFSPAAFNTQPCPLSLPVLK